MNPCFVTRKGSKFSQPIKIFLRKNQKGHVRSKKLIRKKGKLYLVGKKKKNTFLRFIEQGKKTWGAYIDVVIWFV